MFPAADSAARIEATSEPGTARGMDDTNKRAHELILEIYDAALEPQRWPDVLHHACEFVGATGAVVFEMVGTPEEPFLQVQNFSSGYDERIISSYLQNYNEEELVDQAILAAHSRRTDDIQLIRDEVLGNSREELDQREHVQAMKAFGIRAVSLIPWSAAQANCTFPGAG